MRFPEIVGGFCEQAVDYVSILHLFLPFFFNFHVGTKGAWAETFGSGTKRGISTYKWHSVNNFTRC